MKPLDFRKWIDEHRDLLKPPVGNAQIWEGDRDFMVTVVGGPNKRTDYHVNQGEEFFYQVEGDINLRVLQGKKAVDIPIRQGEIFLLPADTPHRPGRNLLAPAHHAPLPAPTRQHGGPGDRAPAPAGGKGYLPLGLRRLRGRAVPGVVPPHRHRQAASARVRALLGQPRKHHLPQVWSSACEALTSTPTSCRRSCRAGHRSGWSARATAAHGWCARTAASSARCRATAGIRGSA